MDTEKIRLSKDEKRTLRHVAENSKKLPQDITLIMFRYCLSTLREKGLVKFRSKYDEILAAGITIKGAAYLERNPKLRNPVDWKWVASITVGLIAAVAAIAALFVACGKV